MDVYIRENNLRWEDCVTILTDGAALMTGKVKGFKAKVREVNPEIRIHQYFLHQDTFFAKMIPVTFKSVLDGVVKIVNFIK
jgi:predicted GTPase